MKDKICVTCNKLNKIEIGGGTFQPITEGIDVFHPNIDARPGKTVDIVLDLEKNDLPFHDNHAMTIKGMHFLQHLNYFRIKSFLKDCYRVLVPGGNIFLMVGDIKYLFRKALEEGGMDYKITSGIWGEHEHAFDYHKWGFTFESLKEFLKEAGFINIMHKGYYNEWEFMIEGFKPEKAVVS